MTRLRIPKLDRGFDGRATALVVEETRPTKIVVEDIRLSSRQVLPVPAARKSDGADRLPELLRMPPSPAKPREDAGKTAERPARPSVEIPTPEAGDAGCMACPTPIDGPAPMLQQKIPGSMCERRQAQGFHRCAGCALRRQPMFQGNGLPPLENGPAHLQHARLIGLFGSEGERFRR